jgi:hypothetical protein
VNDELLARVSETCMDKAMKRLQNEESTRLFKALMHIDPGHFVVVKSPGKSITVAFAKHKCFPKNIYTCSGP